MRLCIVLAVLFLGALPAFGASVTLTWLDNSTNELGFNVERKPVTCAATAAWVPLGGVAAGVKTYADATVVEGASYCYRVNAWNTVDGTPGGMKQFSGWSNEAGATIPFVSPVPPTGLGAVVTP